MPTLYFTVTTDLTYDQRMIRICGSLAEAGYEVVLVGRQTNNAIPLRVQAFKQKRLACFFQRGKLFYAEYNLRLFFFLLFRKMDGICAIDLDSILPCYLVSRIKRIKRIYDAHELFCEMKEVSSRPGVYRFWKWVERNTVPHFKYAYTVNRPIAEEFQKMYGNHFEVIRSIARYNPNIGIAEKEFFILYQGAVNEGRSFETLIPAMQFVNAGLRICGEGNFMNQARDLVTQYGLQDKISFEGLLEPVELREITARAYIGITLFEPGAKSNYYSLANRFFDYMQAATPQLCVDYPVYREINEKFEVALLVSDLSPASIAEKLNLLLQDRALWNRLNSNCKLASKELNWEEEQKKLLAFYKNIFG